MKTWVKILLIILIPTVLVATYLGIKKIVDKVKKFLDNISFKSLSLGDIDIIDAVTKFAQGDRTLQVPLNINIKNDNKMSISISDFNIKLSHNDNVIAETAKIQSNFDKKVIEPAGVNPDNVTPVSYTMDVYLNQNLIDLVKSLKIFSGQPLTIKYEIQGNIFGWFPIGKKTGEFQYPETTA